MHTRWTAGTIHWVLIGALSASAICPSTLLADAGRTIAEPPQAAVERQTVALDDQGMLRGRVRDAEGKLAADAAVVLGRDGKTLHRAQTDAEGWFVIGPLIPGSYEIASRDAAAFLRVETPSGDAPQSAESLEISRRAMVARGQDPGRTLLHRALIGLVIVAAIAIPVAITAADDDDAS